MDNIALKTVQNLIDLEGLVSNDLRIKSNFPNLEDSLNEQKIDLAYEEISSWPNYSLTPIAELSDLAKFCGVGQIFYKDESARLGLGSFKALGGAYAVKRVAKNYSLLGNKIKELVVTTASAGNHGRSVAWGAKQVGCSAKIYVHSGVSRARADAMSKFGADIIRIDGNYDEALAECIKAARENSWELVSDTSWAGYEDVPLDIMSGYGVLMRETLEQMGSVKPTHLFLPAGCGGLAAGLISFLWREMNENLCKLISVESTHSSCILESIKAQRPVFIDIKEETAMVGLSCGEVSEQAWKILSKTLSHSVSISDKAVAPLMKLFLDGKFGGGSIEAGECSTSGAASLLAICKEKKLKKEISLDEESIVLLIGTEGATDIDAYNELISRGSLVV